MTDLSLATRPSFPRSSVGMHTRFVYFGASKLRSSVDFKEHAADDQEQPPENSNELAQKAPEYQEEQRKKGRTVSITQAVNAVQKGNN